jgi:hypothetical protein
VVKIINAQKAVVLKRPNGMAGHSEMQKRLWQHLPHAARGQGLMHAAPDHVVLRKGAVRLVLGQKLG